MALSTAVFVGEAKVRLLDIFSFSSKNGWLDSICHAFAHSLSLSLSLSLSPTHLFSFGFVG
jgi:hypothetical protein